MIIYPIIHCQWNHKIEILSNSNVKLTKTESLRDNSHSKIEIHCECEWDGKAISLFIWEEGGWADDSTDASMLNEYSYYID